MAKFKYKPGSWVKTNYHLNHCSGCSLKYYTARIDPNRGWISHPEYNVGIVPVFSVFPFASIKEGELQKNTILLNSHQLLMIDNEIDYESFISLN